MEDQIEPAFSKKAQKIRQATAIRQTPPKLVTAADSSSEYCNFIADDFLRTIKENGKSPRSDTSAKECSRPKTQQQHSSFLATKFESFEENV